MERMVEWINDMESIRDDEMMMTTMKIEMIE